MSQHLVVNMDIHDIARAAKIYGVIAFYIVHPWVAQRKLDREILHHWREGYGATFSEQRKEAFMPVRLKNQLGDVIADITSETGKKPKAVAASAARYGDILTHS